MQPITDEILYVTKEGELRPLSRYFKPLKGFLLKRSIDRYNQKLDELELQALNLPISPKSVWDLSIEAGERLAKQPVNADFFWRLLALKYRVERISPLLTPNEKTLDWLKKLATEWKEKNSLFWEKKLNPKEIKYLEITATYSDFTELLGIQDFQDHFFNWIIRDRCPPKVFIEYPHLTGLINDHALNGRIGVVGGDKLKIQKVKKGGYFQKIVTLLFEGRDIDILDFSKTIIFRGGLTLTIGEIFTLFRDKVKRFVDVEFFAQGITNWNAQHMGYFVPSKNKYEEISLSQREWWRQLPPIEILTLEEAKKRFGQQINGFNWWVSANAAREYLNLNFEKCHAYLEIAIPYKDGTYNIYDFGKFARFFPYGVVEDMAFFTVTTAATIAYPDENIYHTTRQQVGYGFELNHFQGLELMDEIKQDIIDARNGNLIFQVETENCAQWIQTHLEDILGFDNIPNLFRIKLLKSDAKGVPGFVFNLIRKLPARFHTNAIQAIHYPFGAWKGLYVVDRQGQKIFKALNKSQFWSDIVVYLPALLHKQFERGFVKPNQPHDELDEAIDKKNIHLIENKTK